VFSAEGTYLRQLGKKGHAEGHFQSPEGITSGPGPHEKDDQTLLYICDTGNDRVQARVETSENSRFLRKFTGLSGGTPLKLYSQRTKI
jgi:hypothetical protein